jgi:DNA mismatch repair protein MSH5
VRGCTAELKQRSVLALSQAVDTFSLVRPRLSADNVLNISQGRHLVQECLINVYVPNEVQLGASEKSMVRRSSAVTDGQLVMTGANGSGKTAYGKMVHHPREGLTCRLH